MKRLRHMQLHRSLERLLEDRGILTFFCFAILGRARRPRGSKLFKVKKVAITAALNASACLAGSTCSLGLIFDCNSHTA